MMKTDLDTFLKFIDQTGEQKHFKCGQYGDRPGLLVTVTDRAADTSINMRYECYKMYARAIERAMKAEALVRELVGVIDELCRQINECGFDGEMWDVYQRAKEALGDETR